MASANIFQAYAQPLRSVADYTADMDKAEANALTLAAQRQTAADDAAIRSAYAQSGGDQNKLMALLNQAGNYKAVQGIQAKMLESKKAQSEIDKNIAQTGSFGATTAKTAEEAKYAAAQHHAQGLDYIQTPQDIQIYLDQGIAKGIFPAEQREAMLQRAAQYPTVEAFKNAAKQAAIPVLDRYKVEAENARNAASNARIVEEGKLNRGVTMRGQNLTDARSREATAATVGKPFEVTGPDGTPMLVRQDKQGKITPVQGFGPKSGSAKPLAASVVKQVTEARDNAATLGRLNSTFKDSYAGKGVLGMGADAQLSASGVLGADKDAVEWWKNYRKESELVERHALFGAALTPGEQASWRAADIGPGMDKAVVKKNLSTRAALAKKVLENTRQDMIDAGHSESRVNAIAGRGDDSAPSGVIDFGSLK